ncbi:alpha-galactosidase [Paenibacillus frigoriresistens]|uniref:alpha-galactosidase n=1 Tax=Paenibacillus alginolyticus TaxID=59839 RepID=UPI00156462FE|nr:alpha-galactosidase [Paenibacillus frigoriresistens]NRF89531.1 alpha-galactosidase [Paenibacillus frigoriresistens]
MRITFEPTQGLFHLQNKQMSYVIQLINSAYPAHVYWGRPIRSGQLASILQFQERCSFSPNPVPEDRSISFDTLPQEYPAYGTSDYREPAYQVALPDGSTISELIYDKHRIYQGKPVLEGLPATYAERDDEAETLELELVDSVIGLRVFLAYTIFEQHAAMTRSVRFVNEGSGDLKLLRALSTSVDYPHSDFDLLQLSGSWVRERHIERRPLAPGKLTVESRRGSSSHQHNPFVALLSKDANEDHGDVYGFSLVYSGNFAAHAEVEPYGSARVSMGINPFDFGWLLEPGQHFQTPEAVMVYSNAGLGDMSRTYHKLYRTRLCRGEFRDRTRPVLVNNWEATYFQFNADKIESIASAGKELGIELFVLDDGWFGKRDSDNSSLGDWVVDKAKLPGGLEDLVSRVKGMGLEFGLWFEPEMVSPDSDLYRKHPDWCLHVPNRRRTEGRQQLILDFSRADVCEAITNMIRDILSSAPITYVKWDMNRNMTEIGSAALPPERQRETAHRYMLGLYSVLETLTTEFPHILFESCSGGGGRFDPGMLYYMPQTWTSDNTDAISRLKIQYGTSIVYPVSTMGAHVSAVPNHQVHRETSLEMRGNVAMSGNFGYELDLTRFTDEEKEIVKKQIADYKHIRPLIQFGDMYRLLNPFEGNETAWMIVSEDKTQAMVAYFRVLAEPNAPLKTLRLKGLNPSFDYQIAGLQGAYPGDHLLYAGLPVSGLHGDFQSKIWLLEHKPL